MSTEKVSTFTDDALPHNPLKRKNSVNEPTRKRSTSVQTQSQKSQPVVEWMSSPNAIATKETLLSYIKVGHRLSSISNQNDFCDHTVLAKLLNLKSNLDRFSSGRVRSAGRKFNPKEEKRQSDYKFGGAVKMEDIDTLCGHFFTEPEVGAKLLFADICSGPGGFTEYVMHKRNNQATGFGFTLRKFNDFLFKHYSFTPYYGAAGDGNIYNPDNILSLQNFVLQRTNGAGVDTVMADGGFVSKEKNIQEITSKQLYLCQCVVAL